jgi:hypothetical protein
MKSMPAIGGRKSRIPKRPQLPQEDRSIEDHSREMRRSRFAAILSPLQMKSI